MTQPKWEVLVASEPDRDDQFAEIWIEDHHLAQASIEDGRPIIQIFSHPTGKYWEFDYNDLQASIDKVNRFLSSVAASNG